MRLAALFLVSCLCWNLASCQELKLVEPNATQILNQSEQVLAEKSCLFGQNCDVNQTKVKNDRFDAGQTRAKRYSWGGSSRSSARSSSPSRSRSSSGGFRNRVRTSFSNTRNRIRTGYNNAKSRISSGYNNLRNRLSGSRNRGSSGTSRGRGSSGSSFSNHGSSWFNRGSSSSNRGSSRTWGSSGNRGSAGSRGSGSSIRNKISNGARKLKNKIFGGGGSRGTSSGSNRGTGTTSGSGNTGTSWRRRVGNRISGLKNKIFGGGSRGTSSGSSGKITTGGGSSSSGSTSLRRRIGNGIKGLKNKILGGRTSGGSRTSGGTRFLGISNGRSGTRTSGTSGIVTPERGTLPKQSLFSKIKSKAVPFLKKPSTQRMLKKGAKWILRKYKSRGRNRGRSRYSAVGIYGPGYGRYGGYPYGGGGGYPYGNGPYPYDNGLPYQPGVGGMGAGGFGGRYFGRRTPEVATTEWTSGVSKGHELEQGDSLSGGQSLKSQNGKFEAYLDPSGDFILYSHEAEVAYWHTDTAGPTTNMYQLTMGLDNSLVLRDVTNRRDLWESLTKNMGLGFARLTLKDDGSLAVVDQRGTALWQSNYTEDVLEPRLGLYNNQSMFESNDAMTSPNQRYYAMIEEGTGRLVVYDGQEDKVTWSSVNKQQGFAPFRLTMQPDNNLVVYDRENKVIWSSATQGRGTGAAMARLTDDGAFIVQDSQDEVIWTSNNATLVG